MQLDTRRLLYSIATLQTARDEAAAPGVFEPGGPLRRFGYKLFAARFYVTFRCNSLCSYCNVWQNDKFRGYKELSIGQAKALIDQLYALGIRYIDLTGGEPLLYKHIIELACYAKSLGMVVEVTTNGLGSSRAIKVLAAHVDSMNISLDTLDAKKYRHIRGVDKMSRVMSAIQLLSEMQIDRCKIISVITRHNLDELPNLIRYAQRAGINIYLSGVFEYFENQREIREFNRDDQESKTKDAQQANRMDNCDSRISEQLMRLLYEPFVLISPYFIKHISSREANKETNCRANKSILTIGPDGRLMLPCYHKFDTSIKWGNSYHKMIESREFILNRDHVVGRQKKCWSCNVFPYLGISFSYHFDRLFLYQAISKEITIIKTQFMNQLYSDGRPDTERLYQKFQQLESIIDTKLVYAPSTEFFYYKIEQEEQGLTTPLFRVPVSFSEFIADHLNDNCWGIERSPHFLMSQFITVVLPEIQKLAFDRIIKWSDYLEILEGCYDFQLDWWMFFILRYYKCPNGQNATQNATEAARKVESYLGIINRIIPRDRVSLTMQSFQYFAYYILGSSPETFAKTVGSVSFNDEAIACKYLVLNSASRERLRCYVAFLSPTMRTLLGWLDGDEAPFRRKIDHSTIKRVKQLTTASDDLLDYAETLIAHHDELICLLDQEQALERTEIEDLTAAICTVVKDERRADLLRTLRAYDLQRPELLLARGGLLQYD